MLTRINVETWSPMQVHSDRSILLHKHIAHHVDVQQTKVTVAVEKLAEACDYASSTERTVEVFSLLLKLLRAHPCARGGLTVPTSRICMQFRFYATPVRRLSCAHVVLDCVMKQAAR